MDHRQLASHARRICAGILDVAYPPRCSGCDAGLTVDEQPLCGRCMATLERVDVAEMWEALNLGACDSMSMCFALWMFDKGGILQRAQHLLKYGRRPAYGRTLGRVLGNAWQVTCGTIPDLIVPIPLHRARYYERGYNQSAMLALGMADVLEVPVLSNGIMRRVATKRQTGLTKQQRADNLNGAFVVREEEFRSRHVLLVDDVVTTGATAMAAARAVRDAGGSRVDFAALAFARL